MSDFWRHPFFRWLLPPLVLLLPLVLGWIYLDRRTIEFERLRVEAAMPRGQDSARKVAAAPLPQEQLDAILADMDTQATLPERLARLHDIARQQGVSINKAAYRLEWDRAHNGVLGRYEMQAELDGPYPALRRFLRGLLAADPRLALEGIELRRPSPGSPSVRASVRLVLFVRELSQ